MSVDRTCPIDCPTIPPGPAGQPAVDELVAANGLRFHTVRQGDGPLVLLLHGFPEFWYSWRRQLPALASRFRAVAPDLPGYNLTDPARHGYLLPRLVADLAALIRALGVERAHVVGHDWGGVLAWALAMWAPDRVDKLVILNAPHPAAYLRELRHNPRQRVRSWYVLFFQLPGLPEWLLGRRRGELIAAAFRKTVVQPDAFAEPELEAYREVFAHPAALRGPLTYYRALGRLGLRRWGQAIRPIAAPTLLIWGEQDTALVPELTTGLESWVPDLRIVRVRDAGHWVQLERPEVVSRKVLGFLLGGAALLNAVETIPRHPLPR